MRIKQLFCKFGYHFAKAMAEKYHLENRTNSVNPKEPLFMFGCYDFRHLHLAINHSRFHHQLAVICWGGSDSQILRNSRIPDNDFWADLLRESQVRHIAISPWIADDLAAMGLEYKMLPITPHDNSNIKPEPLGDSIYMYQPQNKNYNGGIYEELKKRLPYNFIEHSFGDMERAQMLEEYKKCFIGLRFTEHDGLSNTVCELGMMGRRVINNGTVPNCISYDKNDLDDIVAKIHEEYLSKDNDLLSLLDIRAVSNDVAAYLNIGEDFLDTEFYK